jgi:hypothetical protein
MFPWKEGPMATTYKPGDTVPRDGKVECTQYNGTKDNVKAGRSSRLVITSASITARAAAGRT